MRTTRKAVEVIFVLTLAALLAGGVIFVAGQAIALIAGQGDWLVFFNQSVKTPVCIAASVCAVAGFLLGYRLQEKQESTPHEAVTR